MIGRTSAFASSFGPASHLISLRETRPKHREKPHKLLQVGATPTPATSLRSPRSKNEAAAPKFLSFRNEGGPVSVTWGIHLVRLGKPTPAVLTNFQLLPWPRQMRHSSSKRTDAGATPAGSALECSMKNHECILHSPFCI